MEEASVTGNLDGGAGPPRMPYIFQTKPKSKKDKDIFNDFLYHCYLSFDKTINSKKHKRKSDKYSIIRQKLINYLIANQNHVMMKLSKN